MAGRYATVVALVLFLLLSATSPFSETSRAQPGGSCAQEINRQEAALRRLNTDAKQQGASFLATDVANTALKGMKDELAGDATADAVANAKAKYEEWKQWVKQVELTKSVLGAVAKCIGSGVSGCMDQIQANFDKSARLLKESTNAWTEATKRWIDSLGNDSISAAAERVDNATSIIDGFATRSGGLFTDAVSGGFENCLRDFEQRAQSSPSDPVDVRARPPQSQPPAPQPPAPASNSGNGGAAGGSSGMSAGAVAGITAAAVGGGVGLYAINEYAKQAQCNQYETEANSKLNGVINAVNSLIGCGSNNSCFVSRQNSLNSALSSLLGTLGNWCTCLGPDAATELSAEDKAMVRDLFSQIRAAGINPGTLPSCFR